jgi:hypothetical protein
VLPACRVVVASAICRITPVLLAYLSHAGETCPSISTWREGIDTGLVRAHTLSPKELSFEITTRITMIPASKSKGYESLASEDFIESQLPHQASRKSFFAWLSARIFNKWLLHSVLLLGNLMILLFTLWADSKVISKSNADGPQWSK